MKTVLIVGSTSTVGRSVGRLLTQNYLVSYAGRKKSDYHLDLNSVDLKILENIQFDIVIHAAANFGGNDDEEFISAEVVNAVGTLNTCCLARRVKAKHMIVISSSFACYTPVDPYYNIYSLSKRHADELSQLYCNSHNLALTILRPTQLYDAEGRCKKHQGLFYSTIEKARKGEDVVYFGNNDALRNFLFLGDFSEIVCSVIQKKITGVFDCSSPRSVRLSEIATTAFKVFGKGGNVRFLPDKPDITDLPGGCGSNLYEKISFKPGTTLFEGISAIKNLWDLN